MKSEWEELALDKIVEFNPAESLKRGKIAKKFTMGHIKEYQRYIPSHDFGAYSGGAKFRNGDTLFARITPCLENGKIAQVTTLSKDEIAFGSTEFIVWRKKVDISDENFVFYLANYPPIVSVAIKSMVGSSGRQRVQLDVLKDYEYICPPLTTQKAIAATLSCLDAKIELNNRINENLEQQAQAIFKSWFVDFEPFQDGEFVESELGLIPEGWKVGRLGEYTELKSGFAFKSDWWVDEGTSVVRIGDIARNRLNFDSMAKVKNDNIPRDKTYHLHTGDLLIAMTGATIAKTALVPVISSPLMVNQRVGKFIPCQKYDFPLPFIFCFIRDKDTVEKIINMGSGSAQPNVSPSAMKNIQLVLPPDNLLSKFNFLCKPFFEKMMLLPVENQILKNIRDTLLPKLMSGEIKVPVE